MSSNLHIGVPKRLYYENLVLDKNVYNVKVILDEPKFRVILVSDITRIWQCRQFWWSSPVGLSHLSVFVHLLTHLFCFKCAQDTVRHGTSVIEWFWIHSTITGHRFFLYLNTKLKYLFVVKICRSYSQKFIHNYNTSYS